MNKITRTLMQNQNLPIPIIELASLSFTVNESGAPISAVTLTNTGGSSNLVSVVVEPTNGTATAPSDFSNSPIAITFAPGQTLKTVNILTG